ncbi:CpsD/CapB family tyrosine-protein kinase [Lactobacillus delbrueckii]|uniref:CpsD/CapB family tyrosine-protein kinase n=1 Tax=Lactobacillus delbrueckii TaxID=1584 RepID=UPI0000E55716|nr:CpsD/CapB family tyrosine-protein kinase [Lactobacillus delbrueckii]ABJ59261.1 Tyrosine-protein kinase [Lactobacillus delbrueckii subsp. bulgaricus ATCC BAA-365]MBT8938427.1 exopolysaccharide biosynthesis protein [Lactobacillus delbrueckii subsp. bulgaricus]
MAFGRKKHLNNDTMKNGVKLITLANPQSVISEQFRNIRTNINFMNVDREVKTIVFTSAMASAGKSTVSANVAITMAQAGKKTILVDADLRRPTMHSTFNVSNSNGLTTLLTSRSMEMDANSVIRESGVENLSILTAGPIPPNPSELLSSKHMLDLIEDLKQEYDMVVLDLASVLDAAETQQLTSSLDGTILVVRQAYSQKSAIKRAVELLKLTKSPILGYVMNDVDADGDDGYGYGYGYGYGEEDEKKGLFGRKK